MDSGNKKSREEQDFGIGLSVVRNLGQGFGLRIFVSFLMESINIKKAKLTFCSSESSVQFFIKNMST